MSDVIKAEALATKICEILGLNPGRVRTVKITLTAGEPAFVWVEMLGTAQLFDIDYSSLAGLEVKVEDVNLAKEGWSTELEAAKERMKFIEGQLLLLNHVQKKRNVKKR